MEKEKPIKSEKVVTVQEEKVNKDDREKTTVEIKPKIVPNEVESLKPLTSEVKVNPKEETKPNNQINKEIELLKQKVFSIKPFIYCHCHGI